MTEGVRYHTFNVRSTPETIHNPEKHQAVKDLQDVGRTLVRAWWEDYGAVLKVATV